MAIINFWWLFTAYKAYTYIVNKQVTKNNERLLIAASD